MSFSRLDLVQELRSGTSAMIAPFEERAPMRRSSSAALDHRGKLEETEEDWTASVLSSLDGRSTSNALDARRYRTQSFALDSSSVRPRSPALSDGAASTLSFGTRLSRFDPGRSASPFLEPEMEPSSSRLPNTIVMPAPLRVASYVAEPQQPKEQGDRYGVGKLYGRSLMDVLAAKQERARNQIQRRAGDDQRMPVNPDDKLLRRERERAALLAEAEAAEARAAQEADDERQRNTGRSRRQRKTQTASAVPAFEPIELELEATPLEPFPTPTDQHSEASESDEEDLWPLQVAATAHAAPQLALALDLGSRDSLAEDEWAVENEDEEAPLTTLIARHSRPPVLGSISGAQSQSSDDDEPLARRIVVADELPLGHVNPQLAAQQQFALSAALYQQQVMAQHYMGTQQVFHFAQQQYAGSVLADSEVVGLPTMGYMATPHPRSHIDRWRRDVV